MDARHTERLLRIFAALLPAFAVGCSDDIDTSQFTEDLCNEAGLQILDAIEPTAAVDYVELRDALNYDWGEGEMWESVNVLDSSGQPCAGASDPAACQAAFEALSPASAFILGGFEGQIHRTVALTRGDDVQAIGARPELDAFLGEIDTAGDAALIATMEGHRLVCDSDNDAVLGSGGYRLHTTTGGGCGDGDDVEEHIIVVDANGGIETIKTVLIEKGDPGCAVGRLPAGRCRRRIVRAAHPVGAFLAEVAQLEAAAVPAFDQLVGDLRRHGAPARMVVAARRARADEVRHARVTRRLAARYGARVVAPRIEPTEHHDLEAVAADNLVEGCVRETFGALVAHLQARRAADPVLRRALGRIAIDETRHAALSWSLQEWARARMPSAARRRLARHGADAVHRLSQELTGAHPEAVYRLAGMPRPDDAKALFGQLHARLLADATRAG